nr:hypothetical protein [Candidatus Sigynarchaeota archaeon]
MSLKNEPVEGTKYSFPVAPTALFNPHAQNPIAGMLPFLRTNTCPYCGKHMEIDDQPESVFVFCDNCNGGFEVSLHMDMETKEAVLAYTSVAGLIGIVDPRILQSLESVLVRRSYSS